MNAVKDVLRHTIELLSEEEAGQLLEFIQRLGKARGISLTLRRLAADPAFKMPAEGLRTFSVVDPIQGTGVAASRLLVENRR